MQDIEGTSGLRNRTLVILALPLLAACGEKPRAIVPPTFDDPALSQGRSVWMQVCRNCHLMGVAGAPAITDAKAWKPRREKGRQALYRSAINGIPAENGWSMPPRGGLDHLSDYEVRLAVDYMLAAQRRLQTTGTP